MRLSGTRNMNGFLARTCLLGITVLKYDLIASSSCSVKFNATQYQLWKCTFRLYNNHFTLMELNLFSDVLRLRAYIYIYIYSGNASNFLNGLNKDFPGQSRKQHACWKPRIVSLRGAKTRDVIDFRVSSSCIQMCFDERYSLGETRFSKAISAKPK